MSAPATSTVPSTTQVSGLPVKLLYGVGEMPVTISMVLFGLFTLFFYNTVMGLPASLVGFAIAGGLVLDAFLDPYIGYRSDRSRHKFGRRHSFMLPGAIALGPCFYLLFSPPRSLGHTGLFLWLFAFWVAVRVTGALYRIPYLSLGAELSSDYDERTIIFAVRALFGLLGALAAAGFSFLVFTKSSGLDAKLNYDNYPRMGLIFGLLMSLTAVLSTLGTLRHRSVAEVDRSSRPASQFFAGFALAMRNATFRSVWFYFVVFFLAVVL